MSKKTRFPENWPSWNKVCGAQRRKGAGTCSLKAVLGCPRCRFHGSGGEKNRAMGELRYMSWIICGACGPQDIPVEAACTLSFALYAELIMKQGRGTQDQVYKAALWLTQLLDDV